ncbi:Periplasmic ligand-binding sensor domain-containing protein [Altibacter lentus]|uniref:Periplasmic ligand-binding sensor domain-containing protein n=1 Tax=Altibacter lentus TaxID=1223410 RepID=UPI000554D40D|nr:T9SS type A sorting domain-containing protein [Altibacter lentus]
MKKIILLSLFLIITSIVQAQDPNWTYIRRDNTGVGDLSHTTIVGDAFDNVWTGGYSSTHDEGSLVRIRTNDTIYTNWGTYNENYLPNGLILDIEFDSTGIIWVGTEVGLATSEDGLNWNLYDTSNSPLLAHQIEGIGIDTNDDVWVVTSGDPSQAGVGYLNASTWDYYTTANSDLPAGELRDIAIDASNTVWIASDTGLIQYDGTTWTQHTTANSDLSSNDVREVEIDDQNRIWALVGNAIDIYDGTAWTQINQSDWPASNFTAYTMDIRGDRVLLAGSNTTIVYFDGSNWHEEYTSFSMFDSFIDSENNYWVSGYGIVARFDGTEYTKYTQYNTGLPTDFNNDIFIDSQGRRWFANGNGGIQVFDCPNWEVYGPNNEGLYPNPQPLFQTTIGTSTTEDGDGDIWFTYDGTSGYAIQIPNGDYQDYDAWVIWDNTNSHPALQFPEEIEATADGHVFIRGSNVNTFMYDKVDNTWTLFDLSNGLTGAPNCLSRHGNQMYLGHYQGIDIYEDGNWTTIDLTPQGIEHVRDIKFDSTDAMWLATTTGLWKYDGSTWTSWDTTNSNIAADYVTAIAIDSNDNIYISAHNTQIWPYYGGISYFDGTGTTFTTFLAADSPLAHKQVEDIDVDSFGNIWALTQSEGFSIYNPNGIAGFECVDRSLERLLSVQDLTATEELQGISFPNPFEKTTTLSFSVPDASPVTIVVYDILGREMQRLEPKEIIPGENSVILDLSGKRSGIYFCTITSNKRSTTLKLIKE